MSTESLHIVHKLIVEVETNSKAKGYALRDEAAGFVSGSLSPALETLFAELEKKLNGKVLTLDHLSVAISAATTDLTHGDIERLICQAVQKEIDHRFSEAEQHQSPEYETEQVQLLPVTKRQLQSVFYFLKTGNKPWWLPDNNSLRQLTETPVLLELARTDTEALIRELASSISSETFLKRMVFQLPEAVLIEWFAYAFHFPKTPGVLSRTTTSFKSKEVKEKWWRLISILFRHYSRNKTIPPEKLEQLVLLLAEEDKQEQEATLALISEMTGQAIPERIKEQLLVASANPERAESPETNEDTPEKADKPVEVNEYTPVENAGLILLHPFLRPFFTEIGLMEGNQLSDPELAAHVLHFLATGNEKAWEYELQFEKFLCGIPDDEPLRQERIISEKIKSESENLLAAVLEHWKVLKSDSPDLLRFEFLQREAKIIEEEFQTTRLVFARKAQDILLDNLPWNLGIVKVDWLKDLLFVEW